MALSKTERLIGAGKFEAVFVAAACIITLVYRGHETISMIFSGIPAVSHISYDGVYYAQIARNLLSGAGLGWEAMTFPVLQPLMVAGASLVSGVHNLEVLASIVNQIAGALLIIPVYLLARELFGVKVAAAAALILIPYPQLVAIACGDTSESLYTLCVFISLLACYHAIDKNTPARMFVAGACLGITYLARPEGLLIFEAFAILAAWKTLRPAWPDGLKGAALKLGLLVAGFTIFALPYASFLTERYGRVVMSPKLPYESVVMKSKVLGLPLTWSDVDGLTPNGKFVWQEKGGAGYLFHTFMEHPALFIRSYFSNLESELPWNVLNSSHMDGYPIVYPLYLWIPAILGFMLLALKPASRWKAVLMWVPFSTLFIYPIFTSGFWIYHVPYVPGLVILACGGYSFVGEKIKAKAGISVPLLVVVTLTSVGYSAYTKLTSNPEKVGLISYRETISRESMKAGMKAEALMGDKAVYMMRWSRLAYYLGGRWINMPIADPATIVSFARANGAGYIVEELVGEDLYKGPEFTGVPGLDIEYEYTSKLTPYTIIIWKLENNVDGQPG
jgi:4-amino-4-deoxy-L-arabinose transferase-like glycosyltransferase